MRKIQLKSVGLKRVFPDDPALCLRIKGRIPGSRASLGTGPDTGTQMSSARLCFLSLSYFILHCRMMLLSQVFHVAGDVATFSQLLNTSYFHSS